MLLPFFYPPFFASGNCLPDPLSNNWNGQVAVADGVEISYLGDRYSRKTAAPFFQKSEPIVLYSTSQPVYLWRETAGTGQRKTVIAH